MKYMIVSVDPLYRLLIALSDRSGIQMRELMITRGLPGDDKNPIDQLVEEYQLTAKENNDLFGDKKPTMDDYIQSDKKLRKLLFEQHIDNTNHSWDCDEGELLCQTCMVDFKRDPVDVIEAKIKAHNTKHYIKHQKEDMMLKEIVEYNLKELSAARREYLLDIADIETRHITQGYVESIFNILTEEIKWIITKTIRKAKPSHDPNQVSDNALAMWVITQMWCKLIMDNSTIVSEAAVSIAKALCYKFPTDDGLKEINEPEVK